MQTKWISIVGICLALILGLPNIAGAADPKPQAPSCQAEVTDRGKRLSVGRVLPGIKIWQLDLHKTDPSGKPIYQYTIKDSRDCWIVVEGIDLDISTFLDLFDRLPEVPSVTIDADGEDTATKSLFALWEQDVKERCGKIDLTSYVDKLEIRCLRRTKIRNLRRGYSISIDPSLGDKDTHIVIFTQHKTIWGIVMSEFRNVRVGGFHVQITHIYDVDLMATNP